MRMTIQEQKQHSPKKNPPWVHRLLLIVAVIFLIYATLTGIQSYINGQGIWGSVVSLVVGSLSLLVSLFPYLTPSSLGGPKTTSPSEKSATPSLESQAYEAFRNEVENFNKGTEIGALIIRTTGRFVGWHAAIYSYEEDYSKRIPIARHPVDRHSICIAFFDNLTPGTYKVHIIDPSFLFNVAMRSTTIVVGAGQLVEIEFRSKFIRYILE
jgi:hypothetical protein